jgi:hypothetical protein
VKLGANNIPRYINERTLLLQRFLHATIMQSYRFFSESFAPTRVIAQLLFIVYCYLSDFIVILFYLLLLPFLMSSTLFGAWLVMSNFCDNVLKAIQPLFGFPFFVIFYKPIIVRPIYMISHDDNCLLILAHLISWIPQIYHHERSCK